MGKTLSDKVWDNHVVRTAAGEPDLLYIDLHLVHEVTSPQAFDGLRLSGRPVRRPDLTLATEDHNTPTINILAPIADPVSKVQVDTLRGNAAEFGVRIHSLGDLDQGVVHIIGPQLGLTQPGMTVVCGDSHTSTHGAFGALAFGIGTSEVEHVLATQTLPQARPKTMAVNVNGELPDGVTAKDVVLALIAKVGTGGGQGYVVEYRGTTIENLSMEGRMTICNMSIEWGAKAGMIAPDETTFAYLKGRPHAPEGADWDEAVAYWKTLYTDTDAVFDAQVDIDATQLDPVRHLGHQPGPGRAAERDGAFAGGVHRPGRPLGRRAGAGLHGPEGRDADARHPRGHRLPRLLHQRPDRGPAPGRVRCWRVARSPTASGCWSCRGPPGCGSPRWPRASTGCSSTPAPSGARPAARCAWA